MSGSIKARISCMVEVPVGTWCGGTQVDMNALTEQVREEGKNLLTRMMKEKGGIVLGTPKVSFIILEEAT